MKKTIKLILILVTSFLIFETTVYADNENTTCLSVVKPETSYYETGWDVYNYICNPKATGEYSYSDDCVDSMSTAQSFCKGVHITSGYKNTYHTQVFEECSEQYICEGYIYNVTCSYSYSNGCSLWTDKNKNKKYDSATEPCLEWDTNTGTFEITVKDTPSETQKCGEKRTDFKSDCQANKPKDYYTITGASVKASQTKTCYQAKIPIYKCDSNNPKKYLVENVREAKYSVITPHGTTIPIYCVNPDDDPISVYMNGTKPNAIKEPIDATKCENSFATPECGYANILIEGYYRNHLNPSTGKIEKNYNNKNYDYAVIGAAMRLWGAHWGDGGFDKTGISDEDNITCGKDANGKPLKNDDCNENDDWIKFVPEKKDGEFLNVYKATVNEMLNAVTYRPGTSNISEVNTNRFNDNNVKSIHEVACSENRMGIFCGTGTGKIHGNNRYMYALALYANTVQGNENMQKHLNEINGMLYGEDIFTNSSPEGAYIEIDEQEHLIKVEYYLDEDVEIDCNTLDEDTQNDYGCQMEQKIVFKDAYGNEISKEYDYYDYCKKNYCIKTIELIPGTVTCDIASGIKVYAKTRKKCGSESVNRYVSCGNTTDTQIMFSFEPDPFCETETEYREVPWSETSCGGDDGCILGVQTSLPVCDKNNASNTIVEGHVSDPSLTCILNKKFRNNTGNDSNSKGYYDYSEMFGVNTNFCRVYCSDKVTYYMAPRQDVFTAFSLKYDIESRVFGTKSSSHDLTSIVKVKRDCVSEIYYDDNNYDLADKVEQLYGFNLKNDSDGKPIDGTIRNWKTLYKKLLEKSSTENDRKEVLNQLIYDLYACNFIDESDMPNEITRPKNSKNVYSVTKKLFDDTNSYCNGTDCVTGSVTYEGGSKYMNQTSSYKYTGTNGIDPALSTDKLSNSSLSIKYCSNNENNSSKNCFQVEDSKYIDKLNYAGASKFTEVKFGKNGSNVKVPTNDYAVFAFELSAGLYNSTIYQLEEYTGNVKVVEGALDDKLITLDKYIYPIDLSVKDVCEKGSSDFNYKCDIKLTVNVPLVTGNNSSTLFNRNLPNDKFVKEVKNAKNYECAFGVDRTPPPPTKCVPCTPGCSSCPKDEVVGFIFRNIDLKNPVPNSRKNSNGELVLTNWEKNNTKDPQYAKYISEVINEIETSGEGSKLYASDYYLEYSYELDGNAIEAIRTYNETHSYFDRVIKNSCEIKNNMYFNCDSQFLNDLHADNNSFTVKVNKSDGVSEFTRDKLKDGGA